MLKSAGIKIFGIFGHQFVGNLLCLNLVQRYLPLESLAEQC